MNVVENIAIPTDLGPYLSLKGLSAYSGMSVRRLRDACTDPVHSLPHFRVGGGKILVRRSEFDVWMSKFRREAPDLDTLASDILKEMVRDE